VLLATKQTLGVGARHKIGSAECEVEPVSGDHFFDLFGSYKRKGVF
jgi:hypothetical protein